jgi:ubiquinone/menaquinone biosynthesis C-methylase UbiE
MGRWSARLAPLFLDFCDDDRAQSYLDVGCGTGALTKTIRARHGNAAVVGLDPSKQFIAHLSAQIADSRSWFCRGDAQDLPFADGRFDAALGLLILQQMPDPLRMVREMARATRPGGTVGTAIWNFQTGMPMFSIFWDAVGKIDPVAAAARRANKSKPITGTSEESLAELWQAAGLENVTATTIELPQSFANLEDFWVPFLSDATPSSSVASKMEAHTQAALKEEIRLRLLGDRTDGPFSLTAGAFAVRGQVPAG